MLKLKKTTIEDLWRVDLDNLVKVMDDLEKDAEKEMMKRLQ